MGSCMIGQTISHYKILEKLGEGGMGVVYKAEDTKLKRIVALKFLPLNLTANSDEKARFVQEAQAAATINHPNVCTIYRIDEHEGQQFIEMEYVEGSTLKQIVPLREIRDSLRYAIQIADALREAHKKEIVHRDIKCENIMVNSAGQIKVMDFGLAKLKGSVRLTRTSSTVGTVAYMSPEQIQGADPDHRADQFSFGVVLYEMLTGRHPFRGEHEAAMMYSIVNEEPLSPVTGPLAEIVSKLLSKDPNSRYARTDELVADLRQIEQDLGSTNIRKQGTDKSLSSAKKRPVIIPVMIVAILLMVTAVWYLMKSPATSEDRIDSIAVLPFRNVSGDPNTEYLSDGITEHIINSLSRLRKLRVIPRSTSFHYKGKESDGREVGVELKVRAVLTGRVIQRGDDLNIQVELIDVQEQSQLWGEQFVRKNSDLLRVQDEIEQSIAQQLHFTSDETRGLVKRSTENTEAYQLYLRGRYYWDKRNVSDFAKALQYFQRALDLDPGYGLAQTGVADCFDLMGLGIYNGFPPQEAYPKAKSAIEKAFQLDSSLGPAYATAGHINNSYEWNWPQAEKDFRKAIELSPKYGTGHVFYAAFLAGQGRQAEATEQFIIAQEVEPLSLPINTWLGINSYWNREYDKSIEQIRKAIELDATFANGHYFIAWPYLAKGMTQEAVRELRLGSSYSGNNPVDDAALVYALAHDGQHAQAKKLFDSLLISSKERYISPHNMAIAYLGIGDTVQFYNALAQTVDEHAFIITVGVLRVDPIFDFARKDPRFIAIWKKTGLP